MNGTGVRVEGAARLASTLRKAGDDLGDLKQANQKAGSTVSGWASVTAPRRSGALGASVRPAKLAAGARVMAGSAGVPYAGPIHWGWPARGIAAQPWVAEAAQSTEPVWLLQYLTDIQHVIDRVKGA